MTGRRLVEENDSAEPLFHSVNINILEVHLLILKGCYENVYELRN